MNFDPSLVRGVHCVLSYIWNGTLNSYWLSIRFLFIIDGVYNILFLTDEVDMRLFYVIVIYGVIFIRLIDLLCEVEGLRLYTDSARE